MGECQQSDAVGGQAEAPVFASVLSLVRIVGRGRSCPWRIGFHLAGFQKRCFHAGAVSESEPYGLVPVAAAILHPPIREHLDSTSRLHLRIEERGA